MQVIREYGPGKVPRGTCSFLAVTGPLSFPALPDPGKLEVTDMHPLMARNLTQKERKSMAASSQTSRNNC